MLNRTTKLAAALMLFVLMGCNPASNNEQEPRYFEFTSSDENVDYSFVAKTSDPEVIEKAENQLQLPLDQRGLHIHGDIERGNDGYNNNWSWHLTPDSWNLVEVSVEVCDGRPQMVEDDLDYWVDEVGYFCPWSSVVLREVQP